LVASGKVASRCFMGAAAVTLVGGGYRFGKTSCTAQDSSTNIVTPDDRYIGGVKIYGAGLAEDPCPGSKQGKGVQHLNSSYWIEDLAVFIAENLPLLQAHLKYTQHADPEFQFNYFLNQANMYFIRSEKKGLRTATARHEWMQASWFVMCAMEVDKFSYSKYTSEQRVKMKEAFFNSYLNDPVSAEAKRLAGKGIVPPAGGSTLPAGRVDLLSKVALERLALHNELVVLKYGMEQAGMPLQEGFKLSKRIDSTKRHFDEAHHHEYHEDAIAHLMWNFMCIYHVALLKPEMNNLPNYEALRG